MAIINGGRLDEFTRDCGFCRSQNHPRPLLALSLSLTGQSAVPAAPAAHTNTKNAVIGFMFSSAVGFIADGPVRSCDAVVCFVERYARLKDFLKLHFNLRPKGCCWLIGAIRDHNGHDSVQLHHRLLD